MMDHQDMAAEPVRPPLKSRRVVRKRIRAAEPRLDGGRRRIIVGTYAVFAVIEQHVEQPGAVRQVERIGGHEWFKVAVGDPLRVAIGLVPTPLFGPREGSPDVIFGLVPIANGVAPRIVSRLDQPFEHTRRIVGVEYAGGGGGAVYGNLVIARQGAPKADAAVARLPSFDT